MDILLIGNGFDLEHKLPTTYRDFLTFCVAVTAIGKEQEKYVAKLSLTNILEHWNPPSEIQHKLQEALNCRSDSERPNTDNSKPHDIVRKIYSCIQDNLWLTYFKKRLSSLGGNWIDFEKEISHVIQTLESVQDFLVQNSNINRLPDNLKSETEEIISNFGNVWFIICNSKDTLLSFRDKLSHDLDKLIHALEIYLSAFVNEIQILPEDISPDIRHLHPQRVLSFNYSNTYERVYGQNSDINYCYIHGKAELNSTVEASNLVLGIDEHFLDDRKKSHLDFLHFRKYYQRIYKATDNHYLDWISNIHRFSRNSYTLYFFGHSLDATDKDVLHQLICNDNVQTKIFYYRKHEHDKRVLGQLIHNLVHILGPDELIRRTGGSHKTIEFIPQTLRE